MYKRLSVIAVFIGLTNPSFSQSPGGISSDLKLWVKAESGVVTTGALVDSWTYLNDGSKSYTATGGSRPVLVTNALNFLPVLGFDASVKFMDGPTGVNAPIAAGDDDYSLFVVWKSNSLNEFQRVWSQRAPFGFGDGAMAFSTWDGSPPGPGVYGAETATSPFSHTIQRNYAASVWNISQLNLLDQAVNDLEIIDDRNISTGITVLNTDPGGTPNGAALRNISDAVHRIGASFDNSGPLQGEIAEIIVFDRSINGAERSKLFSYLALKYGITLQTDLVVSNDNIVWNATANAAYNNAVFGIGRDNSASGSNLLITQSNSIVTGSGDGTGQSGQANIVLSNATSGDDLDFLVIGHNNDNLTEAVSTDVGTDAIGSRRYSREWKVQHTGDIGDINLSIDLSGLTVGGTNPADFRLMIDEDGDGDFTTGVIRYYTPQAYAANRAEFSGIRLNNAEVFTIITQAAGNVLPVTWINFTAAKTKQGVELGWTVANNEAASHYDIQHSTDGLNFEKVGRVENRKTVVNYSFVHNGMSGGHNFYRLLQYDFDGKSIYSKTLDVQSQLKGFSVALNGNPVNTGMALLVITSDRNMDSWIEVLNVNGTRISNKKQVIVAGSGAYSVDLSTLPAGNYFIRVRTSSTTQVIKIVKGHN